MFSFVGFLKGLLIENEIDRTKQLIIQVSPSTTTGTTTTVVTAQTADRTLTLPDATDTLVGKATTDIFTNKTIDADLNTISNIENADIKVAAAIDATKIANGSVDNTAFQALAGASGTLVSTTAVQTLTNKTIDADLNTISNIDDADIKIGAAINAAKIADGSVSNTEFQALNGVVGTIVDTSSIQTLTNKTIDADLNTITNIENADIKAGAAIARNKLANGSVNQVVINDGSGVLSSEAQLAISRGGTGQATANTALNALLPSQSTHSGEFLTTDGTNTSWVASSSGTTVGTYSARGILCKNNGTNPNTQLDMYADVIILKNSSDQIVVRYNPGTITNDISVSGPTANGRDTVTNFSNTFVHFYWIWNGTTLATVSSAVAPPTGPTLPSGYTHWAYAGAVYNSSILTLVYIRGAWVYTNLDNSISNSANATTQTNISLANIVPTNALAYQVEYLGIIVSTAGGLAEARFRVFDNVITNNEIMRLDAALTGLAATATTDLFSGQFVIPYTSSNFRYTWLVSSGTSQNAILIATGYKIPNGGE